jgi:diguanylate cyclase (GGDEF)-like protein
MAGTALQLVPGSEPDDGERLLRLRARIATEIAEGQRYDVVLDTLARTLTEHIPKASVVIIDIDDNVARISSSNAPGAVQRLIHGRARRHWFGAWASAITRSGEVSVPEVAASSLYREHRGTYVEHRMLAVRAVPIVGRHNKMAGALAVYLPEQRIFTPSELDLFEEVASLLRLALHHEQAQQELLDRLRHDPLTGLENRDGLEEHIRRAIDAAEGHGANVGLLFVDIDDLTLVNDSLGHTAGDTIIAMTAERIRSQVLPGDTVVRFGGDEFIVVLERIENITDAQNTAERIRDAIGEPITLNDNEIATTVSIGITCGGVGSLPLQLIDEGHAAVVRAKQGGRGSTATHDHGLDTGAADRLDRETRLREGLEKSEFVLFWQPKVQVSTGRIVGAEALVRWDHPEHGIIGPDEFLATAERSGAINDLSDWVLWQTVKEVGAFSEIDPEFAVAVNMSATQLARPRCVESIAEALGAYDVRPTQLIVELTESVLADTTVVERIHELRELNVRVAIDDFGTGYSSLAYVQQLPVGMIKVDRAFLGGLAADGTGAPILQAAVAMAHALDMTATVEGVETKDQLHGLREINADWAQGYLFAEPSPQANLVSLMLSDTTW